jgi:sulfatase maturation enzyme AslB (radical SAM superfamily)
MEIDITCLAEHRLENYSDSIANSGLQNIGQITWNNALDCKESFVTKDNREEFEDYIKEFGAWDIEEIKAWSDNELNALCVQFFASALKDYLEAKDSGEEEFQKWQENFGGSVYESKDNKFYYYVGM